MQDYPHVQQVWIQTMLRGKGWIVPNYGAPPAEEKTEMLRVVGAYMHIFLTLTCSQLINENIHLI